MSADSPIPSFYRPLLVEAQQGALILTVNRRLARYLHQLYACWQRDSSSLSWPTPAIADPLEWLTQWLAQSDLPQVLLQPAQQQFLWQKIVREDSCLQQRDLLQFDETAHLARQAHQLCCEYRLPFANGRSGWPAMTEEEQAFSRWRMRYLEYCRDCAGVDEARLWELITQAFHCGALSPPSRCWLIGFDEISPALAQLVAAFKHRGSSVQHFPSVLPSVDEAEVAVPPPASQPRIVACANEEHEIRVAADWCREHLQSGHRVGVIVPELARQQRLIERIFTEQLGPSLQRPASEVPINLSLGEPLSRLGPIAVALCLLQCEEPLSLDRLSYLLRSPWLGGGVSAAVPHARAEAWLRRRQVRQASVEHYASLLMGPFQEVSLRRLLEVVQSLVSQKGTQRFSAWAEYFSHLLYKIGWPGDLSHSSDAYQMVTAWQEKVFPSLLGLDAVSGAGVTRLEAASWLQRVADETIFQPEARSQSLQILGLLESSGLYYDAVWVMGLHDRVLPAGLSCYPFLPVRLQKQYGLPRTSVDRERHFSQQIMQRLLSMAPRVVLSYPGFAEGMALSPSPFLPRQEHEILPALSVQERQDCPELESVEDPKGLPLALPAAGEVIAGGTAVLKEQAQCPFRAYARFRLKAQALEHPVAGYDARLRGTLIHAVLQAFWQQVKTHDALLALSIESRASLLQQLVAAILASSCVTESQQEMRALEQQRLVKLALQWLDQEQKRPSFHVVHVEQKQRVRVGPLSLNVVADRVDCLAEGSGYVILDYKTGRMNLNDLLQSPLLEPQLPLYALCGQERPVRGLAFAQLRSGECQFKGVTEESEILPGVKAVGGMTWSELLDQWRTTLEGLAAQFALGCAEVTPVADKVCRYCDLNGLCRLKLRPSDESDGDA
ncbi:MAG: PD-(D/E)XK nuclease family protein [Desulfuromonadaceae bacterium]|nr:PD-(D/E)XK nuclease family protein [Desulfuromonadaceae bacterium]